MTAPAIPNLTSPMAIVLVDPTTGLPYSASNSAPIKVVTANYTVTSADGTICVDASAGNITITFPATSTIDGKDFAVSKIDATGNIVTIAKNAADTFSNAAPSLSLAVQGDSVSFEAFSTRSMLVIL